MFGLRIATLLATLTFLTFSGSAFGYIDGGTGSMLLQAGISGVLGALFLARGFLASLPARFRRKSPTPVPIRVQTRD